MKPQNFPETLVWYYIIGTYIIYLMGAQYVFGPLLAYVLTFYLLRQWWNQTEDTPPEERIHLSITNWVWIFCAIVMEIALIAGHLDYHLGVPQIVRSSVNGWLRTWVLLVLFPLAGHLKIRTELIYRAVCILCLQSLILIPLAYVASAVVSFPTPLYESPLKAFGGSSLYKVYFLFNIDEDNGQPRLYLFAPWAPALALVANIYLCMVRHEVNKWWRWIGITSCVAMTIASVSRLGILCLPFVPLAVWGLTNIVKKPWMQFTAGFTSLVLGLWAPALIDFLHNLKRQFSQARASSSRVREMLGRIAIYRWWHEAPIWGHGIIEPEGPKVVENMPIGSHHTWFGLLFLHGLVGCIALIFGLVWSFIDLLLKAQNSEIARVGLSIVIVLILFTFAESIQGLAYLYWPGLIVLGKAFKNEAWR